MTQKLFRNIKELSQVRRMGLVREVIGSSGGTLCVIFHKTRHLAMKWVASQNSKYPILRE